MLSVFPSSRLAARLTAKGAELERRGLRVTHVRPAAEPLHLGRLAGNHFDLVVRHLRTHGDGGRRGGAQRGVAAAVERAVENVKVRAGLLQDHHHAVWSLGCWFDCYLNIGEGQSSRRFDS